MDAASGFFVEALVLQAVFTLTVIVLVGRRYPARLPLYRFVAPAAAPMLLFALTGYAYVRVTREQGLALGAGPLGRLALAYAVLWLVGVLLASIAILLRRRR